MTGGDQERTPTGDPAADGSAGRADGDRRANPSSAAGPRWVMVGAVLAVVLGAVLLLAWVIGRLVLDDDHDASPLRAVAEASTAPTTPAGLGVGQSAPVRGRRPLPGFGEVQATITGRDGTTCEVCLLAATTADQRSRGLMEVRDLGGYDGMVFVYGEDVTGAFYMRNTPTPLSIAFFGADGRLVSSTDMAPCGDVEGCPTYAARGPFRYAVEVPKGALPTVGVTGPGARIHLDGTPCPLAADLRRTRR